MDLVYLFGKEECWEAGPEQKGTTGRRRGKILIPSLTFWRRSWEATTVVARPRGPQGPRGNPSGWKRFSSLMSWSSSGPGEINLSTGCVLNWKDGSTRPTTLVIFVGLSRLFSWLGLRKSPSAKTCFPQSYLMRRCAERDSNTDGSISVAGLFSVHSKTLQYIRLSRNTVILRLLFLHGTAPHCICQKLMIL